MRYILYTFYVKISNMMNQTSLCLLASGGWFLTCFSGTHGNKKLPEKSSTDIFYSGDYIRKSQNLIEVIIQNHGSVAASGG